jgi:acetoin utilization transport system permease protein
MHCRGGIQMRLKDVNKQIRMDMKKNRSRVFMTLLATAIGCSFLVVLASFGFGLQRSVMENITGDRLLNEIQIFSKAEGIGPDRITTLIGEEHIEQIEKIPEVKAVIRETVLIQLPIVYFQGQTGEARVTALDYPSELKAGRTLYAGRVPESANEIMVGYHFRAMFLQGEGEEGSDTKKLSAAELINQAVVIEVKQLFDGGEYIKEYSFKIVGIAEPPDREGERDQKIYITEELLGQIEQFTQTLQGQIISPGTPPEAVEAMKEVLDHPRVYYRVSALTYRVQDVGVVIEGLKNSGYSVYSVTERIKNISFYFLILKTGLIFVGTIAVIIASIGIYNTMTMAVTESTREIGIMKAIGAHPRVIKRMFLLESSYIGVKGALIGLIIAYAVRFAVNLGLPVAFEVILNETVPAWFVFSEIPPALAVTSFIICVGISAVSGLRPAAKATKVDVLQALRRDL